MEKEVKTLFKYIGGKRWLRNNLRQEFSNILKMKNFDTYVEPFVGGMGAFLSVYDVLKENGIKKIILNDINTNLINFYKIIKEEDGLKTKDLIDKFLILEQSFISTIPKETSKLHKIKDKFKIKENLTHANINFLNQRKRFNVLIKNDNKNNEEKIETAAILLFLQAHCFNGIYRENSKGEYNTPFNWEVREKTKEILEEEIKDVQNVFNLFEVKLLNKSALDIMDTNSENIFYYLDPPYLNNNISENKYNKEHFDEEKQMQLIEKLNNKFFVYSNHHNDKLLNAFKLHGKDYKVQIIMRKNIISASVESRKEDKSEILISSR